jgi:Uncharacterized conserved protein
MKKEKFHIEYVFDKAGKTSLWNYISTPSGLSEWFADSVTDEGPVFTFIWSNYPNKAELISIVPGSFVRFHWLEDESEDTYFEFRIHKIELTGGISLEITDFAYPNEKEEAIVLWENEVKILKRNLGL